MGKYLVQQVIRQGVAKVDLSPYYISSKLAGQAVTLSLHAKEQSLQVVYPQEYYRSLPLKSLQQRALSYQEYVELLKREASTQQLLHALGRWNVPPD
jgi:hypothetical protein